MAGAAQGSAGDAAVSFLGGGTIECDELCRRQPGMAARGELCAIEREEGPGQCMEAEGVAFLDDDTRGLAPDFDDEGFGHGLDLPGHSRHGLDPTLRQWLRLSKLA
jgi:hypothetical protein